MGRNPSGFLLFTGPTPRCPPLPPLWGRFWDARIASQAVPRANLQPSGGYGGYGGVVYEKKKAGPIGAGAAIGIFPARAVGLEPPPPPPPNPPTGLQAAPRLGPRGFGPSDSKVRTPFLHPPWEKSSVALHPFCVLTIPRPRRTDLAAQKDFIDRIAGPSTRPWLQKDFADRLPTFDERRP